MTVRKVSTRSVGLPGYAAKRGVIPYGSTGRTGTPSGSAASTETRSARMLSVARDRYACCSVEPSGRTIRSSCRRYSSSCIQLQSWTRTELSVARRVHLGPRHEAIVVEVDDDAQLLVDRELAGLGPALDASRRDLVAAVCAFDPEHVDARVEALGLSGRQRSKRFDAVELVRPDQDHDRWVGKRGRCVTVVGRNCLAEAPDRILGSHGEAAA